MIRKKQEYKFLSLYTYCREGTNEIYDDDTKPDLRPPATKQSLKIVTNIYIYIYIRYNENSS